MNDWLKITFLLLFAFGAWYALHILGKPRRLTEREFEKRIGLGKSLVSAGMTGLDKFLNPQTVKSIEVVQDVKGGRYDKKQAKGDDDKTDEQ